MLRWASMCLVQSNNVWRHFLRYLQARAYSKNREGTTMSVKREYQRVLQQVSSSRSAPFVYLTGCSLLKGRAYVLCPCILQRNLVEDG